MGRKMNERIRELAEQTGYIWHASGDPQIYEFTPEKLDEFAELIVQECAGVVADAVDHREPASTYVSKITQHFGVGE